MAVTNIRRIRIRPADSDEITVPKDAADLLGSEAELEVMPGQVTIRRSGRLTRADLDAIAKPALTAERLRRHATAPLTDAERAALNEFLDG